MNAELLFEPEEPPSEATVTCTTPAPPGDVAVMDVPAPLTVTAVAGVVPKLTVDPEVNPAPVMVTTVPPLPGPDTGERPDTTGMYVNGVFAEVPPEVVTLTCTTPAPSGDVAVIDVPALFTDIAAAGVAPNETVEPEVKPAPFIVTLVPPLAGPEVGEIVVTTGM